MFYFKRIIILFILILYQRKNNFGYDLVVMMGVFIRRFSSLFSSRISALFSTDSIKTFFFIFFILIYYSIISNLLLLLFIPIQCRQEQIL